MPLNTIDANTLKTWLDNGEAILVDVREPFENASESISGAHLLPLGRVTKSALPDLGDRRLVIHCKLGGRGGSACQKLLAEDPNLEIYNLEGGISAWAKAGLPIQTSGKKVLPLDRQVQLTIGLFVLAGSLLGYFVDPSYFLLSGFFGAGLTFAGLSGFCGLAKVMAAMPWNTAPKAN